MAETNVTKQFPPEVLEKIFEHCGLNELVNIVDVCQLWRDAAISGYNMSGNDLVIRRPDDINNLVSLLCKPVSFTKLHIVWDVPRDVDCTSVSLDALTNVTSLTRLQSFTFRAKADGDTILLSLDAQICDKILDALLTLVLQTSTETLTHFKLIGSLTTWPSCRKVMVELLQGCKHLSHLVLKGCSVGGEDHQRCVEIIPTLTHLQSLDIGLQDTTLIREGIEHDLSFIAAIKRGCPNISNNIMIGALAVKPSDDMDMLQFVSHVDGLAIQELDTDQFTTLLSCFNERVSQMNVDNLNFKENDHLTDDILLSLVQRLRGLKMVNAESCQHLTNEGVVNIITSSPQLKRIDINFIQNIDTDIIQLLDGVVTEQNVNIGASGTKLSKEMIDSPNDLLYTGKNRNICLTYQSEICYGPEGLYVSF